MPALLILTQEPDTLTWSTLGEPAGPGTDDNAFRIQDL
jgi:hypothetical protein